MLDYIRTMIAEVDISHVITVLIALIGWHIVHRLSARRDQINLRKKLKTDFLIKAYQNLANSSQRNPVENSPYFRAMESALADIQLFGSIAQVDLVKNFLDDYSVNSQASLDPLLNALRTDLRIELGYEQVSGNVRWFRPEGAP